MKTSVLENKLRKLALRATPQMRLHIRRWLFLRFSQPILLRPSPEAELESGGAHSVLKRRARLQSRTLRPRIRTLVVNDSPLMLKTLAKILKQTANFDLVGTATNGCQTLRQVSALSPDLVLMDVHLPCLNGIQATQCIKQGEHPPVVVIISSDNRPVTKAMADKAGSDGFLSKEWDLQHRLLRLLEDLFGRSGASREGAIDASFQRKSVRQGKPESPHTNTSTDKKRSRESAYSSSQQRLSTAANDPLWESSLSS